MPATEVKPSFPTFFDRDGSPLENGYIFIGIENQNPEVRTSRQQAYWDISLTIPAAQPIRTIGGYASRNGSPGQLFTDDKHSLTVRDKNMRLIYTSATNLPLTGDLTGNVTGNLTGNVTGNVTGNLVGGTASLTTPLPITSGGTGANTAAGARTALGATTVGSAVFTAADEGAAKAAIGEVLLGPFATTSGSSVTATGIPAWATQVDVLFSSVASAAATLEVRLGDAGGIEATGYNSSSIATANTALSTVQSQTGFVINSLNTTQRGVMHITKGDGNDWFQSFSAGLGGGGATARSFSGGGQKQLSDTLTQLQLVATSSSFSGGSFYVRCR
jgi:hypothetical protein